MTGPAIFVVATPIGNLDDMTLRAIAVLKDCDLVAAEDTRRTMKLFAHFGIHRKELVSYQDHGEEARAKSLLSRVERDGLKLALVTDAGTPCIADPGYRLVSLARERGIPVHPVPGASALTALVSVAGLPSDRFLFVGFLPVKDKARRDEMANWAGLSASIVFYEAPRRLKKTLELLGELYVGARLAIGRELTKLHEEIVSTDVVGALAWAEAHESMKGEAVIMVDLRPASASGALDEATNAEASLRTEAARLFAQGATLKDALTRFRDRGVPRPRLYQLLLEVKKDV